jgi:AcrR family transcriptional regulator
VARKPDPTARGRILDAATRLFDAQGVHAVGLQQIIDELGCGKNLLYREFATKDDLVTAYLNRCRENWNLIVAEAIESHADDPAGQLVAIVRATVEHATMRGFRGCPVHNAYAEFHQPGHPVQAVAVAHFHSVRNQLLAAARRCGAADPRELADRLELIIDGVNANGAALGDRGAARAAVAFAADVVRAATANAAPTLRSRGVHR